jgi:hypothetical protein
VKRFVFIHTADLPLGAWIQDVFCSVATQKDEQTKEDQRGFTTGADSIWLSEIQLSFLPKREMSGSYEMTLRLHRNTRSS